MMAKITLSMKKTDLKQWIYVLLFFLTFITFVVLSAGSI